MTTKGDSLESGQPKVSEFLTMYSIAQVWGMAQQCWVTEDGHREVDVSRQQFQFLPWFCIRILYYVLKTSTSEIRVSTKIKANMWGDSAGRTGAQKWWAIKDNWRKWKKGGRENVKKKKSPLLPIKIKEAAPSVISTVIEIQTLSKTDFQMACQNF